MNQLHDTTIELDVEVEYSTEVQEADPEVGLPTGGITVTIEAVNIAIKGKWVNIMDEIPENEIKALEEEIQEAEQQEYESQFS